LVDAGDDVERATRQVAAEAEGVGEPRAAHDFGA
jgi:hypothetical protein